MSVESSVATGTSNPAASAELRHGKNRGAAQNAAEMPQAGGFSSLLMQLGGDEDAIPGKSALPLDDTTAACAGANPQAEEGRQTAADAALVMMQTLQLHKSAPSLATPDDVTGPEGGLAGLARGGARQRDIHPVGLAGAREERAVDLSVASQSPESMLTQADTADWAQRKLEAGTLQKSTASRAAQMDARSELVRTALDRQDQEKAAMSAGVGLIGGDTRLMPTALLGELDRRSLQRPLDKLSERRSGEDGMWSYQALTPGVRADQLSMSPPPMPVSPERSVAEQVNYWIGQDMHQAELTLDGLGLDAVQVSISLQGNEAHVSFRTDQLATRQVLEGAQAHLRELLESSGLVLSGVSVGSSGAEGAPTEQRRPGSSARQALVGIAKMQPAMQGLARAAPGMGGTVDLFV